MGAAAMEPGLRDREYVASWMPLCATRQAAMEPGLRDREYVSGVAMLSL